MSKSREAFRTISEVSDWLDTPAHVLRFWESKFTQIKPVKRAGGRRYYRPDDMALLSGIKYLLHEQGMTIKGAQKLLREQGVKHVIDLGLAAPTAGGPLIEAEPGEVFPDDALMETDAVSHDPASSDPASSDPASWDPADPWPAEPAISTADLFDEVAETPLGGSHETPDAAPTEAEPDLAPAFQPEPPAPVMPPPPRHEVSLPFVRARAEAAEPPSPRPAAEILDFGRAPRLPVPALPDEDAITGHPGALTAVLGADPARIRAQATRIAPLAGRLKVLADRIGAQLY